MGNRRRLDLRRLDLRRSRAPQGPIRHEVVRSRLVDALGRRFDVAVTTIVAGPGFGKSTLLAQAIRANQGAPRGIDAWVACEPGDETVERLAGALADAIVPGSRANKSPHAAVLEALRSVSPLDICLVVDDVHELPNGSSAVAFIGELIRRLPAHVHLVLSGRALPDLPLARLQAADQLLALVEDDLAFTEDEVRHVARLAGRPEPPFLGTHGGWPSLVRLTLDAPSGATQRFLWEEVVSRLEPQRQQELLTLATLGWGDSMVVSSLCGWRVEVAELAASIPLVSASGTVARCHHLWSEHVARLFPAEQVEAVRRRTFEYLIDNDQIVRAGSLAAAWEDATALRRASLALLRTTIGSMPVDTARRWRGAIGPNGAAWPETQLLNIAIDLAQDFTDPTIDARIDTLIALCDAENRVDVQVAAFAIAAIAAHTRADLARLFAIATRTAALGPPISTQPESEFLLGAVEAAVAELSGDSELALAKIDRLPKGAVADRFGELIFRLQVQLLILSGRGSEAVAIAEERLANSESAHVRTTPDYARWMAGDPSQVRNLGAGADDASTSARDQFQYGAYSAIMAGAVGDRRAISEVAGVVSSYPANIGEPRESAILTGFAALERVLDHDEEGLRDVLDAHLARHPISDARNELHMRRYLPLAYIGSQPAREHWDNVDLGPSLVLARDVARCLLDARAGRISRTTVLPNPPHLFAFLPLPWSVELAARAEAAGSPSARQIIEYLSEWAAEAVNTELHWQLQHGQQRIQAGAKTLLASVPRTPAAVLRIEVLGPLRLLVGDQVVERPELRRARVRELLGLLVVERIVSRDRAMQLLWPDADAQTASQNLRITISRLRQLLEPDRASGDASYFLRVDGSNLRLVPVPSLEVDLWELQELNDSADASRHDPGHVTMMVRVLQMWRGEPLADLDRVPDLLSVTQRTRTQLHELVLRLGETYITEGRAAEALFCAERVLVDDSYVERALRLRVAAMMIAGDIAAVVAAVAGLEGRLAEVGAEPATATRILLRQARSRTTT